MTDVKTQLKPFTPTQRDEKIIWNLYLNGIMTNEQVKFLLNNSTRKLDERLRILLAEGYVARSEKVARIFSHDDKRPLCNFLGNEGAKWCHENHGVVFPRTVSQKRKAAEVKDELFVKHGIGVTWINLYGQRAFADRDDYRYVDKHEMWATSDSFDATKEPPISFPTKIKMKGKEVEARNTKPDNTFGIWERGDRSRGLTIFAEYDRGTEPLYRTTLKQASPYQKLLGYADMYERGLVKPVYGTTRFRVLWVVETGEDRIEGIINVWQKHVAPVTSLKAGGHLFTTIEQLQKHGLLGDIWVNAKGEPARLISS